MTPLGHSRLDDLLARIGSTDPAPGCGAAAGVALALAAACARKAALIAAKHDEDARLPAAAARFARIGAAALAAGDADAAHFARLIAALRGDGNEDAEQAALDNAAHRALALAALLRTTLGEVAALIPDRLEGDFAAAAVLADAAERIERGNLEEAG